MRVSRSLALGALAGVLLLGAGCTKNTAMEQPVTPTPQEETSGAPTGVMPIAPAPALPDGIPASTGDTPRSSPDTGTASQPAAPAAAPTPAPAASPTPAAPAPTTTSVLIKNFAFAPATARVKAGDTVIWMQNDSAPHNIKSSDGSFDSQAVMSRGQTFSHTFTKKGTFTYICGIHPSMRGTVIVE